MMMPNINFLFLKQAVEGMKEHFKMKRWSALEMKITGYKQELRNMLMKRDGLIFLK